MENGIFRPVLFHRLGKGIEELFPVFEFFHVDKINDYDTAKVPQPYLVGDLLDSLEVCF